MLDSVETSGGRKTVLFEKDKGRGGVAEQAAYSYILKPKNGYADLFDSVQAVSEAEAREAEAEREVNDLLETNRVVIAEIVEAINAGTGLKTEIIAAVKAETGQTSKRITEVLDEHTGKDWTVGHRWTMEKGEKNAKRYTLLMAWAHKK
jgi:hypothetical protein